MLYNGGDVRLWMAHSVDGLTWTGRESTRLYGNDPDVLILPDGLLRLFFGSFDPRVGGVILASTQAWAPWDVEVYEVDSNDEGSKTYLISVTGEGAVPVSLSLHVNVQSLDLCSEAIPTPTSGRPPFAATFKIPHGQEFDVGDLSLLVTDGEITRLLDLHGLRKWDGP